MATKAFATIALSLAIILGSLLLLSFSMFAADHTIDRGTRIWVVIFCLGDLAGIVGGIRAIISLNEDHDGNGPQQRGN